MDTSLPRAAGPSRSERLELRALHETSQILSASLDLDFVLSNLLLVGMSKLFVTRGAVFLHEPVENMHRVAVVKGIGALQKDQRVSLDVQAERRLLREADLTKEMASYRIHILIPIANHYRHIGYLGLGAKATGRPFEESELEFMESMVNMSSAAVHNSLMVEELKLANRDLDAKIQQMNTLFDLSQEFNATLDRDHLVKMLSFALMGQLLVQRYALLLKRPGGSPADPAGEMEIITTRGIKKSAFEPRLVAQLGGLTDIQWLEEEGWQNLVAQGVEIALPLRQHGQTCGVLCLGRKMTGQPYTPGDVEFLFALGNLALVSIQNSYLVKEQIEKERLEEEMRLAREIQERLLPQEFPQLPKAEVAALALPSREVGGDYFDVFQLDENRLLLAIADVTGKGVPASLLMANLQACLHVLFPMPMSLEEATTRINRVVHDNTGFDKFITFFWGIYDLRTESLSYVNAGHNPPILVSRDGSIRLLDRGGLLLGIFKQADYESELVQLQPGDVLVLFTDGVTEAQNFEDEDYGEERLEAILVAQRGGSANEIMAAVRRDVEEFTAGVPQSDDLTMVVLKTNREVVG